MRHQTSIRSARRRHAPLALLVALVLSAGAACSWGGDDTTGDDTTQTDSTDDGGGGGGNDNGGGGGGGGGGAQPSPIRLGSPLDRAGGDQTVSEIADLAADAIAGQCPGGDLCVEITFEPAVRDCIYSGSDPAEGDLIEVGATLTLFGDPENPEGCADGGENGEEVDPTEETTDDGTDESPSEGSQG
ncbi:hypothetical protein [Promicromonospora sp. MEB111]|uniref:hypothetical protein n=1 Tax=Promicromonospora sp. MEB111 TaxID=3040301 RepID=UPI00254CAA36|nr:hypothetical protein [Promicromonospora sp. MEB111]